MPTDFNFVISCNGVPISREVQEIEIPAEFTNIDYSWLKMGAKIIPFGNSKKNHYLRYMNWLKKNKLKKRRP